MELETITAERNRVGKTYVVLWNENKISGMKRKILRTD